VKDCKKAGLVKITRPLLQGQLEAERRPSIATNFHSQLFTSPFAENPRECQYLIREPEMPDSTMLLATPSRTSVSSSTSLYALGDRSLSDNQATFLAGLLPRGMSVSDVLRILERMGGGERRAPNEITTDSPRHSPPPAYEFESTRTGYSCRSLLIKLRCFQM